MTESRFSLAEKVAVITGGSRGIGRSIAELFARSGAKVVISSRRDENIQPVVRAILEEGGQALGIAAHVGDNEAVERLVEKTVDAFGGIDILVNNAGTNPHFGPIMTAEESHWQKILDTNLVGYFRVSKACSGIMKKGGGGKIINMASVAGKTPLPGMGVYCVSKAGVIMLTKVLATELAEANITVNAIAPGLVKTKFSRALWENQQIYDSIIKAIPQGRMAEPDEIAGTALYLASGESNFATGAVIIIDGGQILGSSLIQ